MKLPQIIPTVTAQESHGYRAQLELAFAVSGGPVHIDISDGQFSPVKMIGAERLWLPDGAVADVHLMLQDPARVLETIYALRPRVVTVHLEADGLQSAVDWLSQHKQPISLGVLPETPLSAVEAWMKKGVDEIMMFGGTLGYKGGSFNHTQLERTAELHCRYPDLTLSWDGGVNRDTLPLLKQAGVKIFYVGSAISGAEDPQASFDELQALADC